MKAYTMDGAILKVCERNKLMDEIFGSLLEKNIKLEEELAQQAPLTNALLRIANEAWPSAVAEQCMRSVARAALATIKAVPASDRLTVQYANAPTIKKDLTVGPSAMDEGSIGAIESARELVSPAPLPKEVEEALLNLGNVLTDAYDLAWEGETGEEKYANAQTALAVIRAALALREEKK